jgi:hypothetical protein
VSRRHGEYVPLSTTYADDDAILSSSPLAELLFVRGLALAGQIASDGYLTEAQVVHRAARGLGAEKKIRALAAELVAQGLWQQHDGGYVIRAWLKWNKSADELGRERAKDRDRKRAERHCPEPGSDPESDGSPGLVQPDSDRTPGGQAAESGGSPGSHAPARGGARRAVVAVGGSQDDTERHDTLPGAPDKPESPGAHANRLASVYTDLVPLSNHPAAAKIIRKAVDAHVADDVIIKALHEVVGLNRSLTTETLRIAIYGPPKNVNGQVGHQSFRNPKDQTAYDTEELRPS